jgi:hypothetical protein
MDTSISETNRIENSPSNAAPPSPAFTDAYEAAALLEEIGRRLEGVISGLVIASKIEDDRAGDIPKMLDVFADGLSEAKILAAEVRSLVALPESTEGSGDRSGTVPMRSLSAISCYDLARMLPALCVETGRLDEVHVNLPKKTREYYRTGRQLDHLEERIHQIEDLILNTPAVTLRDAAAQLLQVFSAVTDRKDPALIRAARGAMSSFFVVAAACGVDREEIGLGHYGLYAMQDGQVFVEERAHAA